MPAVLAILGKRAWHLPGWIDRRVPDVDVEGEQLIERLEGQAPPPDEVPETVPS